MQYYIVSVDDNYVAPILKGWYGIIDKKTLHRKRIHEISKHLLFEVENNMQMLFTDIITFPCFMVSEMVKSVISMYNPFVKYMRVVLFNKEREMSMTYYIPRLEQIEYVEKADLNMALTEKMKEWTVIEIVKGEKTQVVMRMDIVESILRRNAIGLGLKEIRK